MMAAHASAVIAANAAEPALLCGLSIDSLATLVQSICSQIAAGGSFPFSPASLNTSENNSSGCGLRLAQPGQ